MTRKLFRCAIYTRKSSEEGLEQEFNSLHAQREACEAYIKSQAHEGWRLIPTAYDDGGFSGGSMERPALRKLLADVASGLVDVVVVYKVDRLTRALADFAKIVETLDARGASFVSVTQQFNTTTSMGRLTLNVLLSFAQFEREVTGERIRDKFAASRRKGMWMGGPPPIGYDIRDRRLVVNQAEAEKVRTIFERYADLGCVRRLATDLDHRGIRSKAWVSQTGVARGGRRFSRGALYALLQSQTYLGMAVHKGAAYPGEHQAIITQDLWERVQNRLSDNRRPHARSAAEGNPHLLAGLLFDDRGHRMSPSHAKKRNGKRYRYYVSQALLQNRDDAGSIARVPAHAIEDLVARRLEQRLSDSDRRAWRDLTPVDQAARLRAILRRVVIKSEEVEIVIADPRREGDGQGMRPVREDDDEWTVTIRVPIRLKSCGGERTILTLDGTQACRSQPDAALIKAVVRAHHWQEILEHGEVRSVAELAATLRHHPSYVGSLLGLAFLAPEIVDAILTGQQPQRLTLGTLIACKAPLSWKKQRQALGVHCEI